MFAMSGVQMVIQMIYLLIKGTCMMTSPVIEGYLQLYECSTELLKHVRN